jgi:hypothetical protein
MARELMTAFFVIVSVSALAYPFVRLIGLASNIIQ